MKSVSRITLIALLACAALPGIRVSAASDAPRTASRPNFLVILADDLGYGDLACYGHPTIRTPALDRLATQGARFTSFYAAAPVCSPSRAGLLTGRNPNRTGVYDWIPHGHPMHLPRSEITLAHLLRRAGYATGHFGKWHCNARFNRRQQPTPGDMGFDYWFSTQNNAAPTHHNPTNFVRNGRIVGPLEGYSCQIVADEAIGWLREQRDQPWFAYVCFHEPHEQIASPPELVASYSSDARNENEAAYFANVANIDRAVERLLSALDELKLSDSTVVLFTSDNGPEALERYPRGIHCYGSPGPLRGMKLWLYEGGIRVPAILRWPGHTRAGSVIDTPIWSLDLLPTFCAAASVEIPHDRPIDGTNVLSALAGGPVERRTPLFWIYTSALGEPQAAIREGDWKLVARLDMPPVTDDPAAPPVVEAFKRARILPLALYNLRDDISERTDLSAREPERFARLSGRLAELLISVQQECPVWPAAASRPAGL